MASMPPSGQPLSTSSRTRAKAKVMPWFLQLLDYIRQRVASAGVDEVHRIHVEKHMPRRRTVRGQRSL